MELNSGQIGQLTSVRDMITVLLGPPAGHDPAEQKTAAVQYIVAHLAVTPAQFDAALTADFSSAALVERNTEIDPSGGSPIYSGTPVGVATFDAATTDDTTVDVFAFKGTSNIPSLRHAIANFSYNVGGKQVGGVAEVWGWKRDGSVWNLRTGLKIGSDKDAAPVESVLVSGTASPVMVS